MVRLALAAALAASLASCHWLLPFEAGSTSDDRDASRLDATPDRRAEVTPCTPATCAAGCCDGNGQCRLGMANACGSGGGTCTVCPAGETCQQGRCVAAVTCDATTCANGCCLTGECRAGDEDSACGVGGGVCADCTAAPGYACERSLRTCRALCDSGNCWTGCCDAGICYVPTSEHCGLYGSPCQPCSGAMPTCSNGKCQP